MLRWLTIICPQWAYWEKSGFTGRSQPSRGCTHWQMELFSCWEERWEGKRGCCEVVSAGLRSECLGAAVGWPPGESPQTEGARVWFVFLSTDSGRGPLKQMKVSSRCGVWCPVVFKPCLWADLQEAEKSVSFVSEQSCSYKWLCAVPILHLVRSDDFETNEHFRIVLVLDLWDMRVENVV